MASGLVAMLATLYTVPLAAFADFGARVATNAEMIATCAVFPALMCSALGVLGGLVALVRPPAGGRVMLLGGIVGLAAMGIPFIGLVIEAPRIRGETIWLVPMGIFLVAQAFVIVGGRLARQIGSEDAP